MNNETASAFEIEAEFTARMDRMHVANAGGKAF
jgi:hypothetical protein